MDDKGKRLKLRKLLDEPGIVVGPGCYDALMARMIEWHGFPLAHITGGGISRSLGFPDVGFLTMTEVVDRCGKIARAVDIPVIADADAGYGNVVNVKRAAEEFERAGVASIHIEDEVEPKKCNLLVNTGHRIELIPVEEMVGKLEAAQAARIDPNFLIVARICAKGSEDFEDVLRRAKAYSKAGADILFPIHLTPQQLERVCKEVSTPVLYNVTYHSAWVASFPNMSVTYEALERMGLKIAVMSSSIALAGLLGMDAALQAIKKNGSSFPYLKSHERLPLIEELYLLKGTKEVQEWEARFLRHSNDNKKA
jgi:2-methylisocitrate lyase-like PEP mutase family enzyme